MPLDTGEIAPDMLKTRTTKDAKAVVKPSLETLALTSGEHFGAGMKTAREAAKLSLQDVADATRVRRQYLANLEDMDVAQLPSRPFAIGYVRAYAQVLGIDPEKAVARFKADAPEHDDDLHAPIGVSNERDPRIGLIVFAATIVIGAIVVWNLAQRGMAAKAPPAPAAVEAPLAAPPPPAQVALGEALPAPVESTIPAPYVPPGLEGTPAASGIPGTISQTLETLPEAPISDPRAAAYGAPPEQSVVTLRARKSASLIVRGADGAPKFVRQLSASEVYRVPMDPGLTLEVSDQQAFDVFTRGQFIGQLPALATPASKLGG